MMQSKIAITITHCISIVQLADNISVFENGHVAEYGTHAELYAQNGIYTEGLISRRILNVMRHRKQIEKQQNRKLAGERL